MHSWPPLCSGEADRAWRRTPGLRPGRPASGSRRKTGIAPFGARLRTSARVSQTSPASARQKPPKQGTSGYGGMAAVTATPTTWYDRALRLATGSPLSRSSPVRVIESPAPMPSASAKAASTTTPPSRTQLPWVSLGWSIEAGAVSRPSTCAVTVLPFRPQPGLGDRVWPAVTDDAGSLRHCLEAGQVGGPASVARRGGGGRGDHIGPGRRLSGALVGLADHPVQDEPEGERGRGPHDRQQQKRGFDRAPA